MTELSKIQIGGHLGGSSQASHSVAASVSDTIRAHITTSSSSFMAQPQPIIHSPFKDDHTMPSPSTSTHNAPFNPASYTRALFASGSFGNRHFPGSSPSQFIGPFESVLFTPPNLYSLISSFLVPLTSVGPERCPPPLILTEVQSSTPSPPPPWSAKKSS
jgi:hypothetical protein